MKLQARRSMVFGIAMFGLVVGWGEQTSAGIYQGTTVRLDTVTVAGGVIVRARRLDANGRPTDDIVDSTNSNTTTGAFRLDAGNTPLIQIEVQDGDRITILQRLVGTKSVSNLVIAIPEPKPCYKTYCCRRHRCRLRWRRCR